MNTSRKNGGSSRYGFEAHREPGISGPSGPGRRPVVVGLWLVAALGLALAAIDVAWRASGGDSSAAAPGARVQADQTPEPDRGPVDGSVPVLAVTTAGAGRESVEDRSQPVSADDVDEGGESVISPSEADPEAPTDGEGREAPVDPGDASSAAPAPGGHGGDHDDGDPDPDPDPGAGGDGAGGDGAGGDGSGGDGAGGDGSGSDGGHHGDHDGAGGGDGGHGASAGSWLSTADDRAVYGDRTVGVTHHLFDFLNADAPADWGLSRIGFVVHCDSVKTAQIDPIVNPGQARSAHLHEFFGNPNVTPHTTTQSLVDTPRSQIDCTDENDKSAYWSPTVYQDGRLVRAHHFKAYYKSTTPDTVPIPLGLRMVAGNAKATANQSAQVGFWVSGPVNTSNGNRMISRPSGQNLLTLRVNFPNCWDGRHLDSPDHQQHMAYARNGRCPDSHPVKIPQVVTFTDYRTRGGGGLTLASGEWFTFHQDFWNAWAPAQMEELNDRCIRARINCRARRSPDLAPRGQAPAEIRG